MQALRENLEFNRRLTASSHQRFLRALSAHIAFRPANRATGFLHVVADIPQFRGAGIGQIGRESLRARAHRAQLVDYPTDNVAKSLKLRRLEGM